MLKLSIEWHTYFASLLAILIQLLSIRFKAHNAIDSAIALAFVAMKKALYLDLIARGIEYSRQLNF